MLSPLLLKLGNCRSLVKHCESDFAKLDLVRLDNTPIEAVDLDKVGQFIIRLFVEIKS